ncbi:hypothetical protein B0T22DRAFT_285195 [Podospora appendiculata]|uniref:NADH dehydrogenase [ubiquinone] 1 alpha subcomplex subunit 1 n=1 Tax=Podospora appendiculata TaxID=314037 RepID=A0AAE0X0V8_9PEZI|nr:hypothetical protein B0T22DRAFT_285195 [Podospora appendiculata]
MPIPFESLIPYGIIIAMFGVTGAGLSKIRNMQNGGKRQRRSLDQWDRVGCPPNDHCCDESALTIAQQMMDRDRRLTGYLRGQIDSPVAPPGYELNNPWRVEKRMS